jgi:hypothetical protein
MKRAIAIGILGFALASNRAAAQTAVEREQILRDFHQSVVDYTQHHGLAMFPEAVDPATPAPKLFTLPVAMVFRQIIAEAVVAHHSADPTRAVIDSLPQLPAPLQYRMNGADLEIRDAEANVAVAVLKSAFSVAAMKR